MFPSFPVELQPGRSSIRISKWHRLTRYRLGFKALNQAFTDSGQFETLRYALSTRAVRLANIRRHSFLDRKRQTYWFYVGYRRVNVMHSVTRA